MSDLNKILDIELYRYESILFGKVLGYKKEELRKALANINANSDGYHLELANLDDEDTYMGRCFLHINDIGRAFCCDFPTIDKATSVAGSLQQLVRKINGIDKNKCNNIEKFI